jgi:hypothetical protein
MSQEYGDIEEFEVVIIGISAIGEMKLETK